MGTEVAKTEADFFKQYGESVNNRKIVGDLLKFNKGDYLAGMDEREVPHGTKLVANMNELLVGWIRWENNMPTDQIMGRVVEGYQPPRRKELGEVDEDEWAVDQTGKPRDPWQFSNYLIMVDAESGEIYTFTTASRGGLNAVGDLCKEYGQQMRKHPTEFPVIELSSDVYTHRVKEYGRIKVPILKIVAWEPRAKFEEVLAEANAADPTDTTADTAAAQADAMRAAKDGEPAPGKPAKEAKGGKSAGQETRF